MSAGDWLLSPRDVAATLPTDPKVMRFAYALRHGTMKVGLYAPVGEDTQTPHKQDELYVIVSGSGSFEKEGERQPFTANDVIFVAAGEHHRFVDFTADFSVWVIFWGAEGGEPGAASAVSKPL